MALGSIAAECDTESNALTRGQFGGLIIDMLFYLLPLSVTLHLNQNWSSWTDGYLAYLFAEIGSVLGATIAVAGFISGVVRFTTALTMYARSIWSISSLWGQPHWITSRLADNDVPKWNVGILMVLSALLNLLDFTFLVRMQFSFQAVTYLTFVASFIRLRHIEPHTERKFRVWGGRLGSLIIPIPLVFIVAAVMGSNFASSVALLLAFLGVFILALAAAWYSSKHTTPEKRAALRKLINGGVADIQGQQLTNVGAPSPPASPSGTSAPVFAARAAAVTVPPPSSNYNKFDDVDKTTPRHRPQTTAKQPQINPLAYDYVEDL